MTGIEVAPLRLRHDASRMNPGAMPEVATDAAYYVPAIRNVRDCSRVCFWAQHSLSFSNSRLSGYVT